MAKDKQENSELIQGGIINGNPGKIEFVEQAYRSLHPLIVVLDENGNIVEVNENNTIHINPIVTKNGESKVIRWVNITNYDNSTISIGIDVSVECNAVNRQHGLVEAEHGELVQERAISDNLASQARKLQLSNYELSRAKELIDEMLDLFVTKKYIILDGEFNVIEINDAACRQFDTSKTASIGSPIDAEIFFGPKHDELMSLIESVARDGKQEQMRIEDDGRLYNVLIKPKMNGGTEPKRIHIIINDVTIEIMREQRIVAEEVAERRISLSENAINGELTKFSREIGVAATEVLDIAMVSVWMFSEDGTRLEIINRFDAPTDTHSTNEEIEIPNNSKYISALRDGRSLSVSDAQKDSDTKELIDYLKKFKIHGMTDIPINCGDRIVGVICFEDTKYKNWHEDQIHFMESLADRFAMAIKHKEAIDKEKNEEEKREKEREIELQIIKRFLEDIDKPIYISNTKGGIIVNNKLFSRIFGYSEEEFREIDTHDLWEDPNDRLEYFKVLATYGEIINVHINLKRKDGSTFVAIWNAVVIYEDESRTRIKFIKGDLVEVDPSTEEEIE